MVDFLLDIDKQLFLFINGLNTPGIDAGMIVLTNALSWVPLFLLVIGWMIYKLRWKSVIVLLAVVLVIILTDRISAGLLKPLVGRLRPSHEPGLKDLVHIINGYRGGLYSFVSSHAANAFGVATLLWLLLRKQITWIWVMFIWATFFSYTRIYLGVHYPSDVVGGGVLGVLLGLLVYKLLSLLPAKFNPIQYTDMGTSS